MSILADYIQSLHQSGQVPIAELESLREGLYGTLNWKLLVDKNPEAANCFVWEARTGNWQVLLTDFSIENQPGFQPGDRGQNVALTNATVPIVIMSDGKPQHELAKWLYGRMRRAKADQFAGAGRVGAGYRIKHFEQKEHYEIDSFENFLRAVQWITDWIKGHKGEIWAFERSNTFFRFDEAKQIAYYWGRDKDHMTMKLLTMMGWTLQYAPPRSSTQSAESLN